MNVVRKLRRQKGWSQEQLAMASGLGKATVQRTENGRVVPSWETASALAAALDSDATSIRYGAGLYREIAKVMNITMHRDASDVELRRLPTEMQSTFKVYYTARAEMAAALHALDEATRADEASHKRVQAAMAASFDTMLRVFAAPDDAGARAAFTIASKALLECHPEWRRTSDLFRDAMRRSRDATKAFSEATFGVTGIVDSVR